MADNKYLSGGAIGAAEDKSKAVGVSTSTQKTSNS